LDQIIADGSVEHRTRVQQKIKRFEEAEARWVPVQLMNGMRRAYDAVYHVLAQKLVEDGWGHTGHISWWYD
jgi:hypothetical protein